MQLENAVPYTKGLKAPRHARMNGVFKENDLICRNMISMARTRTEEVKTCFFYIIHHVLALHITYHIAVVKN